MSQYQWPLRSPRPTGGGARGSAWPALATFISGGSAIDRVDPAPAKLVPQIGAADAGNNTLFAIGTTTVTFRYRDASGNIGTATSNVTVVLGTPRISVRIAAKGTVSKNQKYVDLEFSNTGTGNARQLTLGVLLLVPTKGSGNAKLVSPKLPLTIGALDVGRTTTVRVVIDVPTSVNELAITEIGTFVNVKGTLGVYLQIQTFVP